MFSLGYLYKNRFKKKIKLFMNKINNDLFKKINLYLFLFILKI